MEEFDPTLVAKAHAQLMKAMEKEAFAPAAGIGQAPPMDPSMAGGMPPAGGGAPPMDPSMAGGAPPMDPSMMGGAPPMPPGAGGGMPPGAEGGMPPGAEGQMPPVMVTLDDLLALFSQISQEMGGGGGAPAEGGADVSGALDDISKRLDAIEGALGLSEGGGMPPGAAGAMPPMPEMAAPPAAPEMPPMGEAMAPMMDATAAPMPGMPVSASADGQVKIGKAQKIGDLVAKLRRR